MNHEIRMVKIIVGDGSPIKSITPERNLKCRCGSGKKQKNCCGTNTKFYSTKPQRPVKTVEVPGIHNAQPEPINEDNL